MVTPDRPSLVLQHFGLTEDQRRAAAERGRDVVVTAGAGSGKTRTLVARYVTLLAEGLPARRVAAITFTDKAANEMRSRVRSALNDQVRAARSPEDQQFWRDVEAQLDSARISTIHSLCAEILRAHPAEAGIDPRFNVLDEGLAATLQAQSISDTLAWLVEQPALQPLLSGLGTRSLENLLKFLFERRLEAGAGFGSAADPNAAVLQALTASLARPELAQPIAQLRDLQVSGTLLADAGDKLAPLVLQVLGFWDQAGQSLSAGDALGAALAVFRARRNMRGNVGKKEGSARGAFEKLQSAYDQHLNPWLKGKDSKDPEPDPAVEALFLQTRPLLQQAFEHLLEVYGAALRQRQALDFNDLEAGAARLLAQPTLRRRWQAELDALLVDEFQDTNARQRAIVLALCGETPGRLFVVGDARQSIYRFREADVTVFNQLKQETEAAGGLVVNLDRTYRAHSALLQVTGDLLAGVMGEQFDPRKPYRVPFEPLRSDHDLPRPGSLAPHLEFVCGLGEDAEAGRAAAARVLARRLHELRAEGQVLRWDEVTLLFRAAAGFPAYEKALEEAGIPFVTVAGQGFYNRPEIRDVLNLLSALADPRNDLAMAGLLRSPAFGLSDAALYRLRRQNDQNMAYWQALHLQDLPLEEPNLSLARRALAVLEELQPLVDRLPVAELLKRLVDRVDYRAILASAESSGRLWRNLDKLLADAQASGLVNVHAFLDYLETLTEAGAREGEAPSEADGAVRLMTIHKAKGLEFSTVVLADAARKPHTSTEKAYLQPSSGLTYSLDQENGAPLLHRLVGLQEKDQAEAEEKRLLYVALTRAKEKLLVSGHLTEDAKASGGLAELLKKIPADLAAAAASGRPLTAETSGGRPLRLWVLSSAAAFIPGAAAVPGEASPALPAAPGPARPLYLPLEEYLEQETQDEPAEKAARPWRATGSLKPPGEALGSIVHRALQLWVFPGDPALERLLTAAALEEGLVEPAQRAAALLQAQVLLERFRRHPLWQEIDQAAERYPEAPYTYTWTPPEMPPDPGAQAGSRSRMDSGKIDLLYRSGESWRIVDFKTDAIDAASRRAQLVAEYTPQLQRYGRALDSLLHKAVTLHLCFLDDQGQVSLQEVA